MGMPRFVSYDLGILISALNILIPIVKVIVKGKLIGFLWIRE